jgi:hypothetical protein
MSKADFGFLLPLIGLAEGVLDDENPDDMSFGLGEPGADSPLARDDQGLEGHWVSLVIAHSIGAALDHVIAIRSVVQKAGEVTIASPWTLVRGVLEPASVAMWVSSPDARNMRRARALRVWNYDYSERNKWEQDREYKPTPPAKSGRDRAKMILATAKELGMKPTSVSTDLNFCDTVGDAAVSVGWRRREAQARWREASAFAHGRTWPLLNLTSPQDAELIRGGFGVYLTLSEDHLAEVVRLTFGVLSGAIKRYADLSDNRPD